jgi:hypothetical protein
MTFACKHVLFFPSFPQSLPSSPSLLYSLKLVHAPYFSPFYLSPLLMVISTGLKILYSTFEVPRWQLEGGSR